MLKQKETVDKNITAEGMIAYLRKGSINQHDVRWLAKWENPEERGRIFKAVKRLLTREQRTLYNQFIIKPISPEQLREYFEQTAYKIAAVEHLADWPNLAERKMVYQAINPSLTLDERILYNELIATRWRREHPQR